MKQETIDKILENLQNLCNECYRSRVFNGGRCYYRNSNEKCDYIENITELLNKEEN